MTTTLAGILVICAGLLTSCAAAAPSGPDMSAPSASSGLVDTPPSGASTDARPPSASTDAGTPPASDPSSASSVQAASEDREPITLRIPQLRLDESLIGLGLTGQGTLETPQDADRVGWFTGGGRPGGPGPVVLVGHIDSDVGPAVFIGLHQLSPGAAIELTDRGGTVHRYRVTEVTSHPRSQFPTAEVFGAIPSDELRLITCGGAFDRRAGGYQSNTVVRAVSDKP